MGMAAMGDAQDGNNEKSGGRRGHQGFQQPWSQNPGTRRCWNVALSDPQRVRARVPTSVTAPRGQGRAQGRLSAR